MPPPPDYTLTTAPTDATTDISEIGDFTQVGIDSPVWLLRKPNSASLMSGSVIDANKFSAGSIQDAYGLEKVSFIDAGLASDENLKSSIALVQISKTNIKSIPGPYGTDTTFLTSMLVNVFTHTSHELLYDPYLPDSAANKTLDVNHNKLIEYEMIDTMTFNYHIAEGTAINNKFGCANLSDCNTIKDLVGLEIDSAVGTLVEDLSQNVLNRVDISRITARQTIDKTEEIVTTEEKENAQTLSTEAKEYV